MKIIAIVLGLALTATPAAPILPNSAKTPGAVNAAVTQATIQSTICVPGYTATIRPPSSYTTNLKKKQLANGYAYKGDMATSSYEEDHLISLELGGHPTDPKNLWPEPYVGTTGARVKDKVENKLHDMVCGGTITLAEAQRAIATNWYTAYDLYVLGKPANTPAPAVTPAPTQVATPTPVKSSKPLDPKYPTCKAANAAGYGPYFSGVNPEYVWYNDANHDGKVC